ncbi:MAG: branched-chain amino acid ABC transporter permease [Burkholderiales bacterium]|nr:branched-chain amino acid ABC transporter permease [Burkholderiales bacterium]
MRNLVSPFWVSAVVVLAAGLAFTELAANEYYFTAAYLILQALIMAVAWNILGGFTGYVNFGSAGFFAAGAYTSIALDKALGLPLPLLIVAGALVSGLIGLGVGYLTLRLRGVYFAIATLALAIVLETFVSNWTYVGGARGAFILTPENHLWFSSYVHMLFMLMLILAVASVAISRKLNFSRLGRGLAAIRDDEIAAECAGVPTLRLKLVSTTIMGAMMGVAGAPYPFFVTYVEPISAFNLFVAVNAIAMPMIGGTAHWLGPVVGALLVGSLQEIIKVNISSEINILLVGIMLVLFISLAPQGIVGLVQKHLRKRSA